MSYYDCNCHTNECDCATRHIKRLDAVILELEGENERLTQLLEKRNEDFDELYRRCADAYLQLARVSGNGLKEKI